MSIEQCPYLDFHDFHLLELPARLASGNGLLAARNTRELAALCFRIEATDNAYTYSPQANTIHILAGTEADTVIELDHNAWQRLVYDPDSVAALCTGHNRDGVMLDNNDQQAVLLRWQPALKAMFQGCSFNGFRQY